MAEEGVAESQPEGAQPVGQPVNVSGQPAPGDGLDRGFTPQQNWPVQEQAMITVAEFGRTDWIAIELPPPPDPSLELQAISALDEERIRLAPEIIAQNASIIQYYEQLLMASPTLRPNTYLLMLIGTYVSGLTAQHFKNKFNRPRPFQLLPTIMPPISAQTPSYPQFQGLQAFLIALSLKEAVPPHLHQAIDTMSERIARNRVVAGVSYPSDVTAAHDLADKLLLPLKGCDSFKAAVALARGEWIKYEEAKSRVEAAVQRVEAVNPSPSADIPVAAAPGSLLDQQGSPTAAPESPAPRGAASEFSEFATISLNLQQAFDNGPSVDENIRQMLAILKTSVTFDMATYAEYIAEPGTNDGTPALLVRGLYAQDGDTPFAWPARWLRVTESELLAWFDGTEKRVDDIQTFLNRTPEFTKLREHEVVQTYLQRGARSFLIARHKENGHVVSSLTLARREGTPFGLAEEQLLDLLQISRVVRLIREAYRTQLTAFYREMRNLFEPNADPTAVAAHIVRRLCEQFKWDYVAVFRVARARSRFELIAQFNSTEKRLTIEDENYSQPLHEGILSNVRTEGLPRCVQHLPPEGSSDNMPFGYKRITKDAQSCICYPIKLNGEVEWLLDCESAEIGAFQEPDERALKELARDAENSITLWFEMRLSRALLENVDVGVVVVDEENRIQRINPAAEQLLGAGAARLHTTTDPKATGGVIGRKLPSFGADEEASAVLRGSKVAAKPISLRGMDKRVRGVIASSRDTDGAFNRRIWRLSNPAEDEWARDLTYMRATIQGVAQQTRGPLLLADALIAQALDSCDDTARRMLLDRARQCLTRTNITYERLALGREVLREPVRRDLRFWGAFDLGSWLRRFRDALPELDQAALILRIPDGLPALWADHERLGFALRSTLGYLLYVRRPEQVMRVDATAHSRTVDLTITAESDALKDLRWEPPRDPIALFETEAWATVLHAHEAVGKVIAGHKSQVTFESNGDSFRLLITNLRTARSFRHAGA